MSYLLYGQNGLLLDERIIALRNEIDPQNLSTTTIDVQASSVSEIASACQAMPFFGGRRVVVLRNPIQLPKRADASVTDENPDEAGGRVKWADLHAVLKATPATTDIVMRHDGSLAQTHYLMKAVKALGWQTESFAAKTGDDLLAWIQQRVTHEGIRIEPDAVEQLANLLYPTSWRGGRYANDTPDMRLIASEVDKLCCAAVDGQITTQIVDEMVADRSGFKAFELNDQLFRGDPEKALSELNNVLESGEAAERVLSQIGSEAISLATVKHGAGVPPDALAKTSGISPGRLGGLRQKASGISGQGLVNIAEAVRYADATVKTGRQTDTSATIVPLVAEVAEVVRRGSGAGRRRG
ncbi:MAG TPA: DNA polymerase III subunit delta [Thermomicrobiales bacterium]|nr:DNA polymerase III subunit delta [Thermomicrobiales bacterium]